MIADTERSRGCLLCRGRLKRSPALEKDAAEVACAGGVHMDRLFWRGIHRPPLLEKGTDAPEAACAVKKMVHRLPVPEVVHRPVCMLLPNSE